MSNQMDAEELKRFLQDAGMYEDNMNEDEMRNYYNAIKSSESTAKEEDENRHQDLEMLAGSDPNENDVNAVAVIEEQEKMDTSNNKSKDDIIIGKVILNPLDAKPSRSYKFHFTKRNINHNLPPYLDPKLQHLSVEDRAKLISDFHYQQLKTISLFQNISKSSSPTCRGRDITNHVIDTDDIVTDDVSESEETYISRAGRQTRRKDYSEYRSPKSSTVIKREKRDKDFNCTPSTSRQQQIQKLTNDEIIQRSKFFNASPKTESPSSKSTVIKERKSDQEDKIMESSLKSPNVPEKKYNLNPAWLVQSEDIDCDDFKELDVEKFPPLRRRVPPPIRGRKSISKRTRTNLEIESNEGKSTLKPLLEVLPSVSSSNSNNLTSPGNNNGSNKKRKNKHTLMCPICSEYFNVDEVEAHASNCGLGMKNPVIFETVSNQPPRNSLRCDICNTDLPVNTDYEIHVSDCLKRHKI